MIFENMKRIHFFVSGSVQGVNYRHYVAKKANELGIKGFVKNLSDGRVEVFAEGKKKDVDSFLKYCGTNLGYSRVDSVAVVREEVIEKLPSDEFKVKHN